MCAHSCVCIHSCVCVCVFICALCLLLWSRVSHWTWGSHQQWVLVVTAQVFTALLIPFCHCDKILRKRLKKTKDCFRHHGFSHDSIALEPLPSEIEHHHHGRECVAKITSWWAGGRGTERSIPVRTRHPFALLPFSIQTSLVLTVRSRLIWSHGCPASGFGALG